MSELAYPTIVGAPSGTFPETGLDRILPGSEILIITSEDDLEHKVNLPDGAQYVGMEYVEGVIIGTFYGDDGGKVGKFYSWFDGRTQRIRSE